MNVLFNNERLQQLLSNLYLLVGIQTNIYDLDGNDISILGRHNDFCRMINDDPKGHARCVQCDRDGVKKCAETRRSVSYRCHAGLWEVVMPIFDSGELVAFLSFGQLMDDRPKSVQWEESLARLGWFDGDMQALKKAFFSIEQHSENKRRAYGEILEAITSYIQLQGIIRSAEFSDQQRLEMYIDRHYMEKLSLRKISADLNIGMTKLCALAKKISGEGSVTKLISKRRIEAAKVLLIKGDLSISAIAERVGFTDYNYFTKIFKSIEGETPSAYRKHHSGN